MMSIKHLLFWLFTGILSSPSLVWAQSIVQTLQVTITTGGDDLRRGQTVLATVYMQDSRQDMPDIYVIDGVGLANNSIFTSNIGLGTRYKPTDFRAIEFLVDGSPKQAFQSYDNWNLNRIRVELIDPAASTLLLDLSGQPLMRFTGDAKTQRWSLRPQPSAGTGNSANSREMSSYDLTRIKMAIRSEVSDPLATAKTWIRQANRTMTTAQVRSLMGEFRDEAEKFVIIQACYPYVSNRQSLGELADAFSTDSYRRQLATMAQGR